MKIFCSMPFLTMVCANIGTEAQDLQFNLEFSEISPLLNKANSSISISSAAELDGSEIRSKVLPKGPCPLIIK
jgi:hypothetical protein